MQAGCWMLDVDQLKINHAFVVTLSIVATLLYSSASHPQDYSCCSS